MQSRRGFLASTAAAAAALTAKPTPAAAAPSASPFPATRPVVISSANGIRGVKVAYDRIVTGADCLDAIIAGVNIQELDAEDQSVGIGGLPNADGVVQLDASCMHGPTKRAGSVGAIEGIATPSLVAKAVMDYTDHIMLVGEACASRSRWVQSRTLTEKTRQDWLRWNPGSTGRRKLTMTTTSRQVHHRHDQHERRRRARDISSVTSTSGMAWKIPGRIGDSPVIGAGQYCDNTVGAAGSTGRGEANIKVCGGFLTVEFMRQGLAPEVAVLKTLERLVAMTEARLLRPDGRPNFDIQFYALAKDGRYAAGTLYAGAQFAVCDERGARLENCVSLYPRPTR
jgi:N4-(beta-N-acetylglucosaminyl)-L-asparaginase